MCEMQTTDGSGFSGPVVYEVSCWDKVNNAEKTERIELGRRGESSWFL